MCQQRMRLLSTECKSLVKAADEAARVAEYGVDKVAIHATMAKLAERLANLEDVLGKVRLAPSAAVLLLTRPAPYSFSGPWGGDKNKPWGPKRFSIQA